MAPAAGAARHVARAALGEGAAPRGGPVPEHVAKALPRRQPVAVPEALAGAGKWTKVTRKLRKNEKNNRKQ